MEEELNNFKYLLENVYLYEENKPPNWIIPYMSSFHYWIDSIILLVITSLDNTLFQNNNINNFILFKEPVNKAMERKYNQDKLFEKFQYKIGDSYFNRINLAIYCYTPWNNDFNNKIHIINVYGLLLDNELQPDYLYYKASDKQQRNILIKTRYSKIFKYILQCAIYLKEIKEVIIPGIGLNDSLSKINNQEKKIFENIFFNHFKFFISYFSKFGIKLIYGDINQSNVTTNYFDTPNENILLNYNINEFPKINKNSNFKRLYVNECNPWSFIGNEHTDSNFNGIVGQNSAVSVLCWPYTNKRIDNLNIHIKTTIEEDKMNELLLKEKWFNKNKLKCFTLNLNTKKYIEYKKFKNLHKYLKKVLKKKFLYHSKIDIDPQNRLYIPYMVSIDNNKQFQLIYIQIINNISYFVVRDIQNSDQENIFVFTEKNTIPQFDDNDYFEFDNIELIKKYPPIHKIFIKIIYIYIFIKEVLSSSLFLLLFILYISNPFSISSIVNTFFSFFQ